jgi:hypothetical protein
MDLGAADGSAFLRSVTVRPCGRQELRRFRELLGEHHYLGYRGVVGESVAHVAEAGGQWLALLLWAAAAFKCAARDSWIGWHPAVQWQRLHLVANNVRFLVLPVVAVPNLASRVLGLSVRRLSRDWQLTWGHPILAVETFVDPARYRGSCYRGAGWDEVGLTRGFARCSGGWKRHGNPKLIFVRDVSRGARRLLSDPIPSQRLGQGVAKMKLVDNELASLQQVLRQIPDPRKRRGIRHSKTSLLAISVAAVVSGARSLEAIAQWARECTQREKGRLFFRWDSRTKRYEAPSEPTLRRFLQSVDAETVDKHVSGWLARLRRDRDEPIAIDGKALRGARREDGTVVQLLSAVLHSSGITIGQKEIARKSNEIPAAAELLRPLDLEGRCVTADALHTQIPLARFLVEEKKAAYCFTVKGNQPTLESDISHLFDQMALPPSSRDD